MDEQKKQKVMLGVLGALIVGMGAYYFVFRDSGPDVAQTQVQDTGERRSRFEDRPSEEPAKRQTRQTAREETEFETAPRIREAPEREERGRDRSRSRGPERKTKKEIAPAA